ncbi:MAG: NUDIX hydrolase [Alphaproteobacteria bacterium]
MTANHHAVIDAFLQQQTITPLWQDVNANTSYQYNKSGVVPFVRMGASFYYYVMKPCGKSPVLGKTTFQICKGTRQYQSASGDWYDIRSEEAQAAEVKETLAATALREGIEELGLKLENIRQLWDMGAFSFTSATTRKTKYMWLYSAEINDQSNFLPKSDVADSTEECRWVTLAEFKLVGREDHVYILEQIESTLSAHFQE